MLTIVTHPNKILRQQARELKKDELQNFEIQNLIDEMSETMKEKDGIGLAAPQIGKSLQIIIVQKNNETQAFVNPKIISSSWRKNIMEEGCLSLPGIYCEVKRAKKIKMKALSRKGEEVKIVAENLFARVIQHEVDHLEGILIIDRAGGDKCKEIKKM